MKPPADMTMSYLGASWCFEGREGCEPSCTRASAQYSDLPVAP